MLERYEAVLFDFDGVLVDSEPVHFECWAEVFRPFGIPLDWETHGKRCVGWSDRATVEYFGSFANPPVPFERLWAEYPRKSALFVKRLIENPPWADGIFELFKSLQSYKLAIVTSSVRSEIEPILTAAGLVSIFHTVVYGDDVERHKPEPDPYLLAANRLGTKFALVVEDSEAGERSGRAAGFDVLRIPHPSQTTPLVRDCLGLI
jgi:beta-phosphoglucomutase